MVSRGIALSLCLAVASVAQAQVNIELVPHTANPHVAGEHVRVDVMLTQSTGSTHNARLLQLDVNASDPELQFLSPFMHDLNTAGTTDDIRLWDFRAGTGCEDAPADGSTCGTGHVMKQLLTTAVAPGVGTAWIAFKDASPDAVSQITLESGIATKVAEFDVLIPLGTPDGTYMMDVINGATASADAGAKVHWGFGAAADGAITRVGASQITGAAIPINVGPPGGCTINLVSSAPDCGISLWRSQKNFIELTFDGPAVAPAAGEIKIRELLAGGAFGADLSGSFTFTPIGNVLRIDEVGAVLTHRKWYAVTSDGSGDYCSFERDYPVQVGDANADGRVVSFDVSVINGGNPCFACPDDRRDINGDNRITSFDVSVANGSIISFPVTKPDGHACLP